MEIGGHGLKRSKHVPPNPGVAPHLQASSSSSSSSSIINHQSSSSSWTTYTCTSLCIYILNIHRHGMSKIRHLFAIPARSNFVGSLRCFNMFKTWKSWFSRAEELEFSRYFKAPMLLVAMRVAKIVASRWPGQTL